MRVQFEWIRLLFVLEIDAETIADTYATEAIIASSSGLI